MQWKYFTGISLKKETQIRELLKKKYPNETWEQRFKRAEILVWKLKSKQDLMTKQETPIVQTPQQQIPIKTEPTKQELVPPTQTTPQIQNEQQVNIRENRDSAINSRWTQPKTLSKQDLLNMWMNEYQIQQQLKLWQKTQEQLTQPMTIRDTNQDVMTEWPTALWWEMWDKLQKNQMDQAMMNYGWLNKEEYDNMDMDVREQWFWKSLERTWWIIKERFEKQKDNWTKIWQGKVDPLSWALRTLWDVAWWLKDTGMEILKTADDQVLWWEVQTKLQNEINYLKAHSDVDEIAKEYWPKLYNKAKELEKEYPKTAWVLKYIWEDLMAVWDIADVFWFTAWWKMILKEWMDSLVWQWIKKWIKKTVITWGEKIDNFVDALTPWNLNKLKDKSKETAWHIFQAWEEWRDIWQKIYNNKRINTKNIKSYKELKENISKWWKEIMQEENALMSWKQWWIKNYDKIIETPKWEVKTNAMKQAIEDIEYWLNSTWWLDEYNVPLFKWDTLWNVIKKIENWTASWQELWDFARYYWYKFKKAIRTKWWAWDVKLWNISNRLENTRNSLKEWMESVIWSENYNIYRELDGEYADLMEWEWMIDDVIKWITKSEDKLKDIWIPWKITRKIMELSNMLTFWVWWKAWMWAISKAVPNVWNMMMNNISLREWFSKFSNKLNKLNNKIEKLWWIKNPKIKKKIIKEITKDVKEIEKLKWLPYKKGVKNVDSIDLNVKEITPSGVIRTPWKRSVTEIGVKQPKKETKKLDFNTKKDKWVNIPTPKKATVKSKSNTDWYWVEQTPLKKKADTIWYWFTWEKVPWTKKTVKTSEFVDSNKTTNIISDEWIRAKLKKWDYDPIIVTEDWKWWYILVDWNHRLDTLKDMWEKNIKISVIDEKDVWNALQDVTMGQRKELMDKIEKKKSVKQKDLFWKEIKTPKKVEKVKTEVEILPDWEDIIAESKRTGKKRISPNQIKHQQLTPEKWIAELKKENSTIIKEWEEIGSEMDIRWWSQKWLDEYNKYKKDLESWKFKWLEKSRVQKYVDQNVDYMKKLEIKLKLKKILWKEYVNIKDWIEKLKNISDDTIKKDYIKKIKKDISKWYIFPDEVINYDRSFKTAINNRERYEKGLSTSFSSDDSRIVFDEVDNIWAWMKRQDWKELTIKQKDDIIDWVNDFSNGLDLDMKKLAKDKRWVYVHLNWKNPFLTKKAAWVYRPDRINNSVSISMWWKENFTVMENWKKVKKSINTTASHELWHAIDWMIDYKLFDKKELLELKWNYNSTESRARWAKYWNSDKEITARMIAQYIDVKKWKTNTYNESWNRNKEIFDKHIKPVVEKAMKEKLWDFSKSNPSKKIKTTSPIKTPKKITTKNSDISQPKVVLKWDSKIHDFKEIMQTKARLPIIESNIKEANKLFATAPTENINIANTDFLFKSLKDGFYKEKLDKILKKWSLKKVDVTKIIPSQYGDEAVNNSSIYTAKKLRKNNLNVDFNDSIARFEDSFPIEITKEWRVIDWNHRLTAAKMNWDKNIYAVIIDDNSKKIKTPKKLAKK